MRKKLGAPAMQLKKKKRRKKARVQKTVKKAKPDPEPIQKKVLAVQDSVAAKRVKALLDSMLAEGETLDIMLAGWDEEDRMILEVCVLSEEKMTKADAAELLGISKGSLDHKLKRMAQGLKRQENKRRSHHDEDIYGISFTVRENGFVGDLLKKNGDY